MEKITHFINYAATHEDAIVWYKKSNMHLKLHFDTSDLSESHAWSRVGRLHFLGNYTLSTNLHMLNDPIYPALK